MKIIITEDQYKDLKFRRRGVDLQKIRDMIEDQVEIQDPVNFEDAEEYSYFCVRRAICHYFNDCDDDWDDDDSWGEGPQLTSDRLNKIETALEDELDLRGNGFETTRESGGGMGGWEGPMQIMDKNADFDDEDNYITLSVGSSNNDGKMSIVFANYNGEPYFEPDYDALTGDKELNPQQAYKVTKALMKMPEVQKVLKGEMSREEFQPIYDKLKSKFSKGSSLKENHIKLKSLIKRK